MARRRVTGYHVLISNLLTISAAPTECKVLEIQDRCCMFAALEDVICSTQTDE